jgi:hypothetical protein
MDLEDIHAQRMREQALQRTQQGAREDQTRQELTYFLVSAVAIDKHVQKFLAAAAKAGFPGLDGLSKKERRRRRAESRVSRNGRHFYDSGFKYPDELGYYKMHLRIYIEGAWQWVQRRDGWPSLSIGRDLSLGRDRRGIYAGAGFDSSWNHWDYDPMDADADSQVIKVYADPNVTYQNAPEDASQNRELETETVRCLADLMLALKIPIN